MRRFALGLFALIFFVAAARPVSAQTWEGVSFRVGLAYAAQNWEYDSGLGLMDANRVMSRAFTAGLAAELSLMERLAILGELDYRPILVGPRDYIAVPFSTQMTSPAWFEAKLEYVSVAVRAKRLLASRDAQGAIANVSAGPFVSIMAGNHRESAGTAAGEIVISEMPVFSNVPQFGVRVGAGIELPFPAGWMLLSADFDAHLSNAVTRGLARHRVLRYTVGWRF